MTENSVGKMEFPRDVAMQDCFSGLEEPLYGFVSNVSLVEDMPCILGVECYENGTSIRENDVIHTDLPLNMNTSDTDFETQQRFLDRVCGPESEEQNRRQGKPFKIRY